MHPTARLATPPDLGLLVDLMEEFYAESGMPLDRTQASEAFAALLADGTLGAVWVLGADQQPAGYVVLTLGFSMEYGGLDAFVDDLFVRPGARGQGLGRAGLVAVVAECHRRGVRAVHLEVGRANAPAKGLYAEFGFRDNDRQLLTALVGMAPRPP